MKSLKLLILFLFVISFSNAQITINSNDLISIGDTLIQGEDDNITSFLTGGTGEQTWDFSGMTADSQDTLIFIALADAPFASAFPDAELVLEILQDNNGTPDTMFMYIDHEPGYLHILGMSAAQYNAVHSYPYQNIMPFPVTYGDEFYSVYMSLIKYYNGTDSIMHKQYAKDTVNVNAYGDVILPSGTFNSLRFYHNVYRTDSIFIKTGTDWIFVNSNEYPSDYYEWWTNDPTVKMKIAELQTDEQGNVTGGNFMKNVFLHNTSVKNIDKNFSDIIILNIGNGEIAVKNIPKGYKRLCIYDVSGKEIYSESIYSGKDEISVRHLIPGIYIVSVFSEKGKIAKKIVID